jgi:hypothetical protein
VNAEQATSTLSTVLRPAAGVHLFLTRNEGILFGEVGQKLFELNSMAACIWCYIEETCPIESIIHSTARSMHLDTGSGTSLCTEDDSRVAPSRPAPGRSPPSGLQTPRAPASQARAALDVN